MFYPAPFDFLRSTPAPAASSPRPRVAFRALLVLAVAALSQLASADYFWNDVSPMTAVLAPNGLFCGSALEGGRPGGFLYCFTPAGQFRVLHLFPAYYVSPTAALRGSNPEGGLGVGVDGSVYGSTREGGVFANGVLFKLDRRGAITNVYHYPSGEGYKGDVVAARNGDLYAVLRSSAQVVCLSLDGSHTEISTGDDPGHIVETATGTILFSTYASTFTTTRGTLWKIDPATHQSSVFADIGDFAASLVPLADGSVLCLTPDKILKIDVTGKVTVIHRFSVPFEGQNPNFLVVEQDGSYLGSTATGGIERGGTVFRIVPSTGAYTVLSHLPAPVPGAANISWMKRVFPLRVAALAGNHPPIAQTAFVAAASLRTDPRNPSSLPSAVVHVLSYDSDADRNPLRIVSVGAAANGTAALDFISQTVTYTASSNPPVNDAFDYTIVDGSGGRATGHVIIRTNPAGHYSGTLSSPPDANTGDPGTPVGTVNVAVSAKRALSALVTVLGKTYRFVGTFNERNQFAALLESHPNQGSSTGAQLWLKPNGATWTVEATVIKNGLPYYASCPPAG